MAAKDADDRKQDEAEPEISLDMSQAAVKKMIADAKARGFITYDQLNQVLPPDQVSSEQIEDVMSMLSEMGINVIEEEEAEEDQGATEVVETSTSKEVTVAQSSSETLDRTDDPVRMYLREMGSVELLSREGEIAIAKRIEAGRGTMISGLCESPLTFQAITIWRDELLEEKIMLRDVIDLETTFGAAMEGDEEAEEVVDAAGATAPAAPAAAAPSGAAEGEKEGAARPDAEAEGEEAEEEDEQANLSLAAMEAALKPDVLAKLDRIADDYTRLREMQVSRIGAALSEKLYFSAHEELEYQRLRSEIVTLVNELHFHNNRIEALVDQLYGINRRLITLESALVKIADQCKVDRKQFIDEYRGSELDPGWLERVGALKGKGWALFLQKHGEKVEEIRGEVGQIGRHVGVDIGEFRRIVQTVQKGEKEARQAKKEMVEANLRLVISIAK
ncbi:MAG TPA: RNA polymerase sigma factor region1.1 domain-containing protein, partial [Paracoccaceae bacterium]|nr:RNA polymerase sigma factor region1.1 domain-containing protein [Paracoccaceae bacterium]